jgi:hypothetical protein
MKRTTCRISGEELTPLFSLGELYVSDFLKPGESVHPGQKSELDVHLGEQSGLVQLGHSVDPDKMYKRYWYFSHVSGTMRDQLDDIVEDIHRQLSLDNHLGSIWLDIGCNDGTLLEYIAEGIETVGFDPAENNCRRAREFGDHIAVNYFNAAQYWDMVNKKAKVVTSIAMFYDLEDPHKFVEDVREVLDKNGLWVIQMSYMPLMLQQLAFDNICHEHLEYYSLTCLQELLEQHGMRIVDTQLNDTNGGSFRVYVMHMDSTTETFGSAPYRDVASYRTESVLARETELHLDTPEVYLSFSKRIEELKERTVNFITSARAKGKSVWAYGASTKGNTLLQYFGLNHTMIDGIAERTPEKFGLRTVGTDIPIYSESEMREARPDYALVLPWHFINEFQTREADYLRSGGKFVVPCPKFEIIG